MLLQYAAGMIAGADALRLPSNDARRDRQSALSIARRLDLKAIRL